MAAGATYEPIETNTLSTPQASVTFNSFSGYTDLVLICSAKNTAAGNVGVNLRFNNDTGSNYSVTRLYSNGSTVTSDRYSNQTSILSVGYTGGSNTSSVFAPFKIQIMNYSNSTTHKTILSLYNAQGTSDPYVLNQVGLYRSTSAITSLNLFLGSNNFDTGSTFTLYGIKAA